MKQATPFSLHPLDPKFVIAKPRQEAPEMHLIWMHLKNKTLLVDKTTKKSDDRLESRLKVRFESVSFVVVSDVS